MTSSSSPESSFDSTGAGTSSGTDVNSVTLSSLRAPEKSAFTRKRKTKSNHSSLSPSEDLCKRSSSLKKVTPAERLEQFVGEPFTLSESDNNLFCLACKDEIGLKKSVIANHIKARKHTQGKLRLSRQQSSDSYITKAFKEYNDEHHSVGEHLPEALLLHRVKVVTTFVQAGVSLSKIDLFRDLLEENGYRLGGRRTMADLIPFIHLEEQKTGNQ